MKSRMFSRTAIAALALVTFAACADTDGEDTTMASTDTTAIAPPPPAPPAMTDSNILAALIAADSMEMAMAAGIKSMGTDAGLKQYGAMIMADHSKHLKDIAALSAKDSIAPMVMMGDTSAQHMANMKTAMSGMTKGMSADSTFIEEAIKSHEGIMDQLNDADGVAQNTNVKALVAATKTVVQKHIDDAKALKDKMEKAMKH